MPLATFYDHASQLLRIVGEGAVSIEDRHQIVRRVLDESEYSNESNIIIDVSDVTDAPSDNDVMPVAYLIQLLRSRFSGRVGIVNIRAGHVSISHIIALLSDIGGGSVRVFSSDKEALAWFKE